MSADTGLGGWTPSAMRSTLQSSLGTGSDYDVDDAIRFVRGVANVVRKREGLDFSGGNPTALSVFLLAPGYGSESGLPREPMLDAGHTPVAGKVWFVNAGVISGHAKALEWTDADSLFRAICDELGLGQVPAAIVDPRGASTAVRFYPKGLDEPDEVAQVRIDCADVDFQKICEVVESVYTQCLKTPDAQPQANRIWKDPSRFWPKRDAELRVQAYLKPAFSAAFPTCRIYSELAGTMGRVDIHLEESDPSNPASATFLAVLELKVLRSFSETGKQYSVNKVKDWVEAGVRQAAAYRDERNHRVAAMCCFDMREDDSGEECFVEVRELATNLGVELRRWFIFASSERAREAATS